MRPQRSRLARALDEAPYLRTTFSFSVMLVRTNADPAELASRTPHPP